MTTFLLDQCVNRKSLAHTCNAEGRAVVKRFPSRWKTYPHGFKDPQLLPEVLAGDDTLITNDRNIAKSHVEGLIPEHPGIIIIGHPPRHLRPIGRGEIDKLIAQFKGRFPSWHAVDWANSVVEITPESVAVWHIEGGTMREDAALQYTDPEWDAKLLAVLEKNRKRVQQPLPPPD